MMTTYNLFGMYGEGRLERVDFERQHMVEMMEDMMVVISGMVNGDFKPDIIEKKHIEGGTLYKIRGIDERGYHLSKDQLNFVHCVVQGIRKIYGKKKLESEKFIDAFTLVTDGTEIMEKLKIGKMFIPDCLGST